MGLFVKIWSMACGFPSRAGVVLAICISIPVAIKVALDYAATDYPYSVLTFHLRHVGTTDDIREMVIIWRKDEWGAQIGAMRVICERFPSRLSKIGDSRFIADLCRLSN